MVNAGAGFPSKVPNDLLHARRPHAGEEVSRHLRRQHVVDRALYGGDRSKKAPFFGPKQKAGFTFWSFVNI